MLAQLAYLNNSDVKKGNNSEKLKNLKLDSELPIRGEKPLVNDETNNVVICSYIQ